jgi:hypothetical protein
MVTVKPAQAQMDEPPPTLSTTEFEPPGLNCPDGGTVVRSGPDTNRNSVLDPAEINLTEYSCQAVPVRVRGFVKDYFSQATLSGAEVFFIWNTSLLGSVESVADGSFIIELTSHPEYDLIGLRAPGFVPTRNLPALVTGSELFTDVFVVAQTDLARQYTLAGQPQAGASTVFVDLVDSDGAPRAGISSEDIRLVDSSNAPISGSTMYFVGASGDIDPTLTQSTVFNGRARAVFLNVPQAALKLAVVTSVSPLTIETVDVNADIGGSPGAVLVQR